MKTSSGPLFVVHKHSASHLHYDFRLEHDGVLKSWAIPKEISLDPKVKRLAIQVEDHKLSYATFEGTIPEGLYGAGKVEIWDQGHYLVIAANEKKESKSLFQKELKAGELKFILFGKKLKGEFALIRMKKNNPDGKHWLLIKKKDEYAIY